MSRSHRTEWSLYPLGAFSPDATGRMRLLDDSSDSSSDSSSSSSYGGYSNASLASYASQGWGGASAAANTSSLSSSSSSWSMPSFVPPSVVASPDSNPGTSSSSSPSSSTSPAAGPNTAQMAPDYSTWTNEKTFTEKVSDFWYDNKAWLAPVLTAAGGPPGAGLAFLMNVATDPGSAISSKVMSAIGAQLGGIPGAIAGSYAGRYLANSSTWTADSDINSAASGGSTTSSSGGARVPTAITSPGSALGLNTSDNPFTSAYNQGEAERNEAPRQRWVADTSLTLSTDRRTEQRDFYDNTLKPQVERGVNRMNTVADNAMTTAGTLTSAANDQINSYNTTWKPIEDRFASDAMEYDSDANVGRRSGMAAANVNQQFSNSAAQKARMMGRFGLNPNSSTFAAQAGSDSRAQALASAGAQTKAAFDTMDTAINLRGKAAEFGQNKLKSAGNFFAGGMDAGRLATTNSLSANSSLTGLGGYSNAIESDAINGINNYSNLSMQAARVAGSANALKASAAGGQMRDVTSAVGGLVQAAGGWQAVGSGLANGARATYDWATSGPTSSGSQWAQDTSAMMPSNSPDPSMLDGSNWDSDATQSEFADEWWN